MHQCRVQPQNVAPKEGRIDSRCLCIRFQIISAEQTNNPAISNLKADASIPIFQSKSYVNKKKDAKIQICMPLITFYCYLKKKKKIIEEYLLGVVNINYLKLKFDQILIGLTTRV